MAVSTFVFITLSGSHSHFRGFPIACSASGAQALPPLKRGKKRVWACKRCGARQGRLPRLQLAIDYHDLAVAEGCHVGVVGGDEKGCLVLAVHVAQEGEDLVGGFAV